MPRGFGKVLSFARAGRIVTYLERVLGAEVLEFRHLHHARVVADL